MLRLWMEVWRLVVGGVEEVVRGIDRINKQVGCKTRWYSSAGIYTGTDFKRGRSCPLRDRDDSERPGPALGVTQWPSRWPAKVVDHPGRVKA